MADVFIFFIFFASYSLKKITSFLTLNSSKFVSMQIK